MNDIKRGEMFYISRGGVSYSGSEQHSDRPAVVVSNDKNNENSNVVEVVYMTTQPKTDLALVGGSCYNGDYCGADYLALNNSAGNAYWNVGASVFLEQPIAA